MRKVIGIGETIMDIIFKNGQPTAAVPGGSVFNGIISLGRLGVNVTVISETGNDRVGREILKFMEDNGVDSSNVNVYEDGRTAISLAWLNEKNDAEYDFYKDYLKARLMMSSYFVLNPALRTKVREFLTYARSRGALIYYDFNYRSSHKHESLKLRPDILENIEFADIVRGPTEDLDNMFGCSDPDRVYKHEIAFYCKNMICTDSDGDIRLFSPQVKKNYKVKRVETVSTIGAGDNFNAGIVYGLLKENILRDDLANLSEEKWNRVVQCGMDLASQVCQSLNNSISKEFAKEYKK